jgi:hypothetical protein
MNNPLYQLMMYNLVKEIEKRNPNVAVEGEHSIFVMTDVIALATNQMSGQVMLDFLKKQKEMKEI